MRPSYLVYSGSGRDARDLIVDSEDLLKAAHQQILPFTEYLLYVPALFSALGVAMSMTDPFL